jgi:hypothetical protein
VPLSGEFLTVTSSSGDRVYLRMDSEKTHHQRVYLLPVVIILPYTFLVCFLVQLQLETKQQSQAEQRKIGTLLTVPIKTILKQLDDEVSRCFKTRPAFL